MKTLRRMAKIYFLLLKQNLKALTEYRIDFLTGAVSFLVDQAVGIGFIFIIFSQIPALAGYTLEQIIFIYGFSLIPKGLDHMFTDNLWSVGYFIVKKGNFDAMGELVTGLVLVCYSAPLAGMIVTPLSIVLAVVCVLFASLIYTAIKIGTSALAFKIKVSGQIIQVFYMTNEFAKYPTTIYSPIIRTVITYIVPFAFTGYYPCVYLLTGENPLFNVGGCVGISIVMTALSLCIWNLCLRQYESAGS